MPIKLMIHLPFNSYWASHSCISFPASIAAKETRNSMVPSSLDIKFHCSNLSWHLPALVPPGVHSGSAPTHWSESAHSQSTLLVRRCKLNRLGNAVWRSRHLHPGRKKRHGSRSSYDKAAKAVTRTVQTTVEGQLGKSGPVTSPLWPLVSQL